MDDPEILLTNDDGIDSPGLHALYNALSTVGSVTVVAPADDQSAVGRALSRSTAVTDHDRGYVIDGTPSDCVVAGLQSLVPETDIVVAGCNRGANMGAAVLGRSGTISAAVEASFLGVPSMAVSLYIPAERFENGEIGIEEYAEAADATTYLVDRADDTGIFEDADYLNINAPTPAEGTGEMVVTRPSRVYLMDSQHEEGTVTLTNHIWERMADGTVPDADGTDRRAVVDGKVSVSPLAAPHPSEHHDRLDAATKEYKEQ
jgi:5'-nucleotidase